MRQNTDLGYAVKGGRGSDLCCACLEDAFSEAVALGYGILLPHHKVWSDLHPVYHAGPLSECVCAVDGWKQMHFAWSVKPETIPEARTSPHELWELDPVCRRESLDPAQVRRSHFFPLKVPGGCGFPKPFPDSSALAVSSHSSFLVRLTFWLHIPCLLIVE